LDLLPWTASGQVRPGGALNDLTVRAIGPHLTFLVNGTEVASIEDTALGEGAVGLFVGGDFNDVVLQKLLVQVPELSERDGDPAQQASEHVAEAALRGATVDLANRPWFVLLGGILVLLAGLAWLRTRGLHSTPFDRSG